MSKTKNNAPALGADYSAKMKSRYAEKVKASAKIYSKADRRENRVVENMTEEALQQSQKKSSCHGHCLCGSVSFNIMGELRLWSIVIADSVFTHTDIMLPTVRLRKIKLSL